MTSGQKIAVSMLSAFALFGAFVLSFHTFLFKEIEMKFYTQAKIEENVQQLNNISESYDLYIKKILEKIETSGDSYVKDPAVKSFYAQNPSEKEISDRRKLTEELLNDIPALDGMRLLDKNGRNVHFTTYDKTDVLKQSGISKIYKNYPDIVEDDDEIPFEVLSKNINQDSSTIMFDEENSRIIAAVPFSWIDGIYSGSFLFYFNLRDVEKEFIKEDVINLGQNLQIVSDDDLTGGLVIGVPSSLVEEFKEPVLDYFESNINKNIGVQTPEKLLEKEDGIFYVALSSTVKNDNKIIGVYTSDLFELSTEIKILIYICVFISIFLILFLVFSLKRDPIVVLKHRIKKIQYGLIKEYIDKKEEVQWGNIANQLKFRKNELSAEILKSIHVHSKKHKQELDDFLDKNWEDIFAVMDSKDQASVSATKAASVNVSADSELLKEIRNVLSEVLREVQSEVRSVKAVAPIPVSAVEEVEELDDVEEIEEVEELDDAEEIEEVEDLDDAEEIEDVEELDDVEEIEEVEELDDVEEIEEVEELDDAEEIEEVEELDDVEEIEEAEELDEAEEIEEAEELDDVEEIEEVEELDEAEEIEDVEELDDAEEIEDVEELDEIEELEEADPDAEVGHIETNPINGTWDEEFFKNFCGAFNYEYKPSNDTFFATERFPTVDNLFAEELVLGSPELAVNEFKQAPDIIPYKLEVLPEDEEICDADETLEELPESSDLDDMFIQTPAQFSLTSFGEGVDLNPPTLEAAEQDDSIVEKDGVFQISDDLNYTDVIQDEEFKSLVDSIIEK